MTKTELSRFQTIPNAKIFELERLIRHRDGIRVERSTDQPEEIQQASERALAVCNLDRNFSHLRNVGRAQEGSFGICQKCDDDSAPKRLVAVPWAQFCVRCQEAVDRSLEEIQAPSGDGPWSSRLRDHDATTWKLVKQGLDA